MMIFGRGRRPKKPEDKLIKISVYVTKDELEAIRKIMEATERSQSTVVRELLKVGIKYYKEYIKQELSKI